MAEIRLKNYFIYSITRQDLTFNTFRQALNNQQKIQTNIEKNTRLTRLFRFSLYEKAIEVL